MATEKSNQQIVTKNWSTTKQKAKEKAEKWERTSIGGNAKGCEGYLGLGSWGRSPQGGSGHRNATDADDQGSLGAQCSDVERRHVKGPSRTPSHLSSLWSSRPCCPSHSSHSHSAARSLLFGISIWLNYISYNFIFPKLFFLFQYYFNSFPTLTFINIFRLHLKSCLLGLYKARLEYNKDQKSA